MLLNILKQADIMQPCYFKRKIQIEADFPNLDRNIYGKLYGNGETSSI